MQWKNLETVKQLDEIIGESHQHPVLIFKHSTRCSISSMAKNRLDRHEVPTNSSFYYLDLIAHRDISNKVAEVFQVKHESPQVLLIKNGACEYEESHNGITFEEIEEQLLQ
jgi:bacillithiol system protein YtxJ